MLRLVYQTCVRWCHSVRFTLYGVQKAIELVKQATEADNAGDYETALKYYESGVEHFLHALKCKAVSVPV